jgi:predicted  nucleic acid-binding Zn-ribbon protein
VHTDLEIICALWGVDHAVDSARARLRALKQAVDDGMVEVARIVGEQERVKEALAAFATQESGLQKELDAYVRRRDKAARLMEGGSALDYLAVERQQVQCGAKVDELEGLVLTCMEAQEAQEAEAASLVTAATVASTAASARRDQWMSEGRDIGADLERLDGERTSIWADFPHDIRRQYQNLRRRNRVVVVDIVDDCCSACSMRINAQVVFEIQSEKRAHSCRGCHRWFRGVAEAEPLDATGEGA